MYTIFAPQITIVYSNLLHCLSSYYYVFVLLHNYYYYDFYNIYRTSSLEFRVNTTAGLKVWECACT